MLLDRNDYFWSLDYYLDCSRINGSISAFRLNVERYGRKQGKYERNCHTPLRKKNMDSFEQLVGSIFEKKGHWVKYGVKVNLTKEEKVRINRHSSPRWELDIVAYKPRENKVYAIECKSYLDSRGVGFKAFTDEPTEKDRYKLFNDENLRNVVFNRLRTEMTESGLCQEGAEVQLCLVAGKVVSEVDRSQLKAHFLSKGWEFYGDDWIRRELLNISESGYEDNIATITAKILLRNK